MFRQHRTSFLAAIVEPFTTVRECVPRMRQYILNATIGNGGHGVFGIPITRHRRIYRAGAEPSPMSGVAHCCRGLRWPCLNRGQFSRAAEGEIECPQPVRILSLRLYSNARWRWHLPVTAGRLLYSFMCALPYHFAPSVLSAACRYRNTADHSGLPYLCGTLHLHNWIVLHIKNR